jgi:RsiW-degrading membrane proteinase PrsW (M82 family)
MLDTLMVIALAPVAIILFYIYKKDSHKEPGRELGKAFGFGALAVIPVIIFELIIGIFLSTDVEEVGSPLELFINTFIGIALIEELFKYIVVRFANYNNKHFDQSYDAIVYCVYAALGFACVENLLYVLTNTLDSGLIGGVLVGFFRGFMAVPSHAFDAVIMGFFMALAKIAQSHDFVLKERKYLFLSVLIPTFEHTTYDFLLGLGTDLSVILAVLLTISMYILCILLVKKAAKNNIFIPKKDVIPNQNLNS